MAGFEVFVFDLLKAAVESNDILSSEIRDPSELPDYKERERQRAEAIASMDDALAKRRDDREN